MKYYLIAGEASGDLHGANLIRSIKQEDPGAEFRYFGGDLMRAEGGTLVKHISEMAFMGFVEVLLNIRVIFKNLKEAKEDIIAFQPDVVILIDFPGFNLKIADFLKKQHIKVFYYISPKIWAWNQKRVLKIKKVVDRMFCILPFEVDFYKKWGMDVDYIGNPLMDALEANKPDDQFKIRYGANKPVIALLPGSRKQELSNLLPDMIKVADLFPDHQFIIAGAPNFDKEDYQIYIGERNIPVVFNETYNLLLHSDAAVVTSGTATLETALLKVPEVVVYKGNAVSIGIARMLIKIRFISLVNLIMDNEIVKELIQQDCTPANIAAELKSILFNSAYRTRMLNNYSELAIRVNGAGASSRAAKLMVNYLRA
ncbi:MAG TPA: lipid-A-disaccharide synthase [Sphingobacteriaceae bacterium]|nr:lipid-A-disaccharide synthase [Sphingobacteriaceae bacterium]